MAKKKMEEVKTPVDLGPVTMDDVEGTMAYLHPRLKNPKTKAEAQAELAEFNARLREKRTNPKWER